MYKSPIDIFVTDIQHQIAEQQDEQIYQAVVSVGISVDKAELIRALQYDRGQYEKGYRDGVADAVVHGRWIWSEENECWVCSNCGLAALNNYRGDSTNSSYCSHCGAHMDGEVADA